MAASNKGESVPEALPIEVRADKLILHVLCLDSLLVGFASVRAP
jgi:hypothetical protein